MKLFYLLALLFMMGCSHKPVVGTTSTAGVQPQTTSPIDPTQATPAEVQALANYAKLKGIRWRVVCTGGAADGDDTLYFGWAIQPGAKFALYIEDGMRDDWIVTADSQKEAVVKLLRLIHEPPNAKAGHRPPEMEKRKKHCFTNLTSDNYTERCASCEAQP